MRSIKIQQKIKSIVLSFVFLFLGLNYALAQSHTVLVLDTSKSVSNGKYFSYVKEVIKDFVSSLDSKDKISLFTFDSEVKQILFKETATSQEVILAIDKIQPQGLWTYTSLMLKKVVNFLQTQNNDAVNLLIFSDGLDDPPPTKSTNFASYQNPNNKIFYIYYREGQAQKNLITKAFPDAIFQKASKDKNNQQNINYVIFDYLVPRADIEFQRSLKGLLSTDTRSTIVLNLIANKAAAGKEGLINIKSNSDLFKKSPNRQTRFFVQEGVNNFSFPYIIKNSFQGKKASINFQFSLAESPTQYLYNKNIKIKIAELPFLEKLYKLPLYSIPFLFVIFALFYILYRIIRYQFFTPVIEMSYKLQNRSKNQLKEEIVVNSVDMGLLTNGKYIISSRPDAFLVLPELSNYTELTLIKKGRKFKTRLMIHHSSIRNILTLEGSRVKKSRIRNGSSFCLDDYIFSFKTNLS